MTTIQVAKTIFISMTAIYNDWNDYIRYYQLEYPSVADGEQGGLFFILVIVVCSPLFMVLSRKFWPIIPALALCIYPTFLNTTRTVKMDIAEGGKTLVIKNKGSNTQWANVILEFLRRLADPSPDPINTNIRRVACYRLSISNRETRYTLPSRTFLGTLPRRQIILTNHTTDPYTDAMAFFPIIPGRSRLIVVQQHYSNIINLLTKRLWGAWTINKDDKTPEGRDRTRGEMEKLLNVMRGERDLTVVFFGTGIVPKSVTQSRNPKKIYPGAVYLSLMSGYPVTMLINDLSPGGVFRSVVREPIDLRSEYAGRIVSTDDVQTFKSHPGNEKVIEEICERLRGVALEEYNRITKIEKWTTGSLKTLSERSPPDLVIDSPEIVTDAGEFLRTN